MRRPFGRDSLADEGALLPTAGTGWMSLVGGVVMADGDYS